MLADSAYIGADTLASFEKELAGSQDGNLQKADLDSVVNYIVGTFQYKDSTRDTFSDSEMTYIKQIIQSRIDSHFKVPSQIIFIPQDSIVTKIYDNGITWIKATSMVFPGSSGSIISNGKLIRSLVQLKNVLGNEASIVKEGLSGRIEPNEVGLTSPIRPDQTVLHRQTTRQYMQPADDWAAKIAERYYFNTPFGSLLVVGNLNGLQSATHFQK